MSAPRSDLTPAYRNLSLHVHGECATFLNIFHFKDSDGIGRNATHSNQNISQCFAFQVGSSAHSKPAQSLPAKRRTFAKRRIAPAIDVSGEPFYADYCLQVSRSERWLTAVGCDRYQHGTESP